MGPTCVHKLITVIRLTLEGSLAHAHVRARTSTWLQRYTRVLLFFQKLEASNKSSLSNHSQTYTPDPTDKACHERLSSDPGKHFKTCSPILYLGTVSSPINLTSRPLFTLPTLKQWGTSSLAFFFAWQRNTLDIAGKKEAIFHSSAPVAAVGSNLFN